MMNEKEVTLLIEFKEYMLLKSEHSILTEILRGHIALLKLVRDGGLDLNFLTKKEKH